MLAVYSMRSKCNFETTFEAVFKFPSEEVHLSVRFFLIMPHLARLPWLHREWHRLLFRVL